MAPDDSSRNDKPHREATPSFRPVAPFIAGLTELLGYPDIDPKIQDAVRKIINPPEGTSIPMQGPDDAPPSAKPSGTRRSRR